jgi:hypothetical protein
MRGILNLVSMFMVAAKYRIGIPKLEIVFRLSSRGTETERFVYHACDVQATACGEFFNDEVRLQYTVPKSRELQELTFSGPVPLGANVTGYEVVLDGKKYESTAFAKFDGRKVYKEAKDTEAVGKLDFTDDMFTFAMKIPAVDRKTDNLEICLRWHRPAQLFHGIGERPRMCYVFPTRSFYKYGADAGSRLLSSLLKNKHGSCELNFRITFLDGEGWIIEPPDDCQKSAANTYEITKFESDGDITFSMEAKEDRTTTVRQFTFGNHPVLELCVTPTMGILEKSIMRPREVILVVDKSGSMVSGCSDHGMAPYELVAQAAKLFISIVSGLDIYVNIVFFDHEVGSDDVLWKEGCRKIDNECDVEAIKEKIEKKTKPNGGTNILLGLRKAVGLKRTTLEGGERLQRNIVLLTDGGDSNLTEIRALVEAEANEDMRFFAVGIGTAASLNTVETVGVKGNGSFDVLRSAERISGCLSKILEKTGAEKLELEYKFGVEEKGVMHFARNGKLELGSKAVQIPCPARKQVFYSNEKFSVYFIMPAVPERFVFDISVAGHGQNPGGRYKNEISIGRDDFIKYEAGQAEVKILKHMLAHGIDEEFRSHLLTEMGKSVQEQYDQRKLDPNLGVDPASLKCILPPGFWDVYREEIAMAVAHDLLTPDTVLMIGDNLPEKCDLRKVPDETLAEQYCEFIAQKREETRPAYTVSFIQRVSVDSHHTLSASATYGSSARFGSSYDSSSDSFWLDCSAVADTLISSKLPELKIVSLLEELIRLFDGEKRPLMKEAELEAVLGKINSLLNERGIRSCSEGLAKKVIEESKDRWLQDLRGLLLVRVVEDILRPSGNQTVTVFLCSQRAALVRKRTPLSN